MINTKKIIIFLITLDLLVIIFSLYKQNGWFINTQLALLSSLFIYLGSFFGYKRMIEKKIANGEIPEQFDSDKIDNIEDKHQLYNESEPTLKEIIQEEKAKLTTIKSNAKNLKNSISGFLSWSRIGGYIFLILSFLYLNRHEILNIKAFLLGLSIIPLIVILSIFFKEE